MWMNRMIEKETSAYVYYYHYLHAFSIMFSSIYVALHMRTPISDLILSKKSA